jgi:hypothetical protein
VLLYKCLNLSFFVLDSKFNLPIDCQLYKDPLSCISLHAHSNNIHSSKLYYILNVFLEDKGSSDSRDASVGRGK